MENDFLLNGCNPAVFCVGNEYQIVFLTAETGIGWVECGGRRFTDNICGVVRSADTVHRVSLPQALLDTAGGYTVGFAHIEDRKPYFPESGEKHTVSYRFRAPDATDGIQIYMLADTHSHVTAPSRTAKFFGNRLDLLILCGDIGNSAKDLNNMLTIHRLASEVTGGERPVVFARGNHDTRGAAAELLPHYVGNDHGNTYFTFRAGPVWGVVLDCGEDKSDSHLEYGDIANYRQFREAQTAFLHNIIENSAKEYASAGVTLKLGICHIPFTQIVHDFADDIYNDWTDLLGEIGIDMMLTGHRHRIMYREAGVGVGEKSVPTFPVVVGSRMQDTPLNRDIPDDSTQFTGTALEAVDGIIDLKFTNSKHEIVPYK